VTVQAQKLVFRKKSACERIIILASNCDS